MQLTLNNATPNQMEAVMEITHQLKLARQIEAYDFFPHERTEWEKEWGYNEITGNVYCALDNGITISAPDFASGDVSFYIYTEEGEEEFDHYVQALKKLEKQKV